MTEIVFNPDAFRAVRESDAVMAELVRRGRAIADAAGGAGAGVYVASRITGGRGRAHVSVVAASRKAQADEVLNHSITGSVSVGQGDTGSR